MKIKKKSVKAAKAKVQRKPVSPDLEFYKDSKSEWRWRVVKRGEPIAVSSEGYKRKPACIKGALIAMWAIGFSNEANEYA